MRISDDGLVLQDVYNVHTGKYNNYFLTTIYVDGTPMNDTKCDGVVFRKYNNQYWQLTNYAETYIDEWGAKGDAVFDTTTGTILDGGTDDSAIFIKALAYCAAAKAVLLLTPGKKYIVENLKPARFTSIKCNSAGNYRFGALHANPDASAWLVHKKNSNFPCLNILEPAVTLQNLLIFGNNNNDTTDPTIVPKPTVYIENGFEMQMDNVRIFGSPVQGLLIIGLYNVYFNRVFVDNCGSMTIPAVTLNSNPPDRTINTLNWNGLTIERSKNRALVVGGGTNTLKGYPEMLSFLGLHVESPSDNGGLPNQDALIRFENFRNVTLVSPFLYGGPGYILEHDQSEPTSTGVFGGITILGGTILGRNASTTTTLQPPHLIHLVAGDGFSMNGTVLDNCGAEMIVIDPTYGPNVWLGTQNIRKRGGLLVQDNRTVANPNRYDGANLFINDSTFRGHIISKDTAGAVTATPAAGMGTAPPTINMVKCNDTCGTILWGTGTGAVAGIQFTVKFERPYLTIPNVQISAGNAATAVKSLYKSKDVNGFSVYMPVDPASSQGSTTYQIDYLITG